MRKLYLLFPLLVFISVTCEDEKVEEQEIIFVKTFGGNENDKGRSVQQTTDGVFSPMCFHHTPKIIYRIDPGYL